MSKKIMNSEKSDLKAMYDRLANSPVIVDDEKFNVTDDDIAKYNEKHDSDLNVLLLHVDTLFDTNDTDRESNVKEFLDTLLDKIKLADDNETKQIDIYKSLSTDKIKNISRKLGLEENIEKTETLLKSKQHECREIRDNTKKKVEELKTERDIEKMKTEDARVKYFNQTLSLHDGLQEEDNNLNAKIIDNDEIQLKYKDFEDSIQSRQECFSNQIRHREIEIQLLRARLEQEQQFEEQNNRRKEAYDESIEQHMNSEKERLEKIELYKTYLSSSSTSPEQVLINFNTTIKSELQNYCYYY